MVDLGHAALGAWSGGKYMHFGERLEDADLEALLRPGGRLRTVVTADVYGAGEGDRTVARATADLPRGDFRLVGAVGHDFYDGERQGAKGFQRFTDPGLRGSDDYADYLLRAAERSLERCGTDRFDLLLLHNPDRVGYTSEAVWDGMAALRDRGLADAIGVAPGPANGFTLDVLTCLERFGDRIDWAMLILGPMEPWPGSLVLPACAEHDVRVLARVVDYGGVMWGDLTSATPMGERDHRRFRPDGWIDRALPVVDELRTMGRRRGLTPMQVAAEWTLAQPAVSCVVPTLIQEQGTADRPARPVGEKRAELDGVTGSSRVTPTELERIRTIGDNAGSMDLKGASPVFEGDERPDGWAIGGPAERGGASLGHRPGARAREDGLERGRPRRCGAVGPRAGRRRGAAPRSVAGSSVPVAAATTAAAALGLLVAVLAPGHGDHVRVRVGQERELAGLLHRTGGAVLVAPVEPGRATRANLAAVGDEGTQRIDVEVIDLCDLLLRELRSAPCAALRRPPTAGRSGRGGGSSHKAVIVADQAASAAPGPGHPPGIGYVSSPMPRTIGSDLEAAVVTEKETPGREVSHRIWRTSAGPRSSATARVARA